MWYMKNTLNGFEYLFTIVNILILSQEEVKKKLALVLVEC